MGKPPAYTEYKGRQLASIQIQLSGGLRPFASERSALRFTENVTAAAGVFTQPEWNPATRSSVGPYEGTIPFDHMAELNGPLMTLHVTGVSGLPVSLEQSLRRAVDGAGQSALLVQRLMRDPWTLWFQSIGTDAGLRRPRKMGS